MQELFIGLGKFFLFQTILYVAIYYVFSVIPNRKKQERYEN